MFALTGVPIDSAGTPGGTELAPGALRALGLAAAVGGPDLGDLEVAIRARQRDPATGVVGLGDVCATTAVVRDSVASTLDQGMIPFLVGGCCSLVPGALAGARDALGAAGLAHVDGHLDLYDEVTSPSGEAADMPLAVALGLGPGAWVEAAGGASLTPDRAWVIGYRDREQARRDGMAMPEDFDPPVRCLSTEEVRARGLSGSASMVAHDLELSAGRFWAHLDLDVVDPALFVANDAPVPDGIDWDELVELLRPLLASPALAGFSLGCYNPEKDPDAANGRTIVEVISAALAGLV